MHTKIQFGCMGCKVNEEEAMGVYSKSGDSSQDCSKTKQKGRKWAKSNNKLSETDKCVKKKTHFTQRGFPLAVQMFTNGSHATIPTSNKQTSLKKL